MGLAVPKALTAEEVRRNVEIVLRRNWAIFPRTQIEQLLGYTPREFDEFLGKEIFLRALLAGPPDGLKALKFSASAPDVKGKLQWFAANVARHLQDAKTTPEEPRLGYIADLSQAHKPGDYVAGTRPGAGDVD